MPRRRRQSAEEAAGPAALESLVQQALDLTRKARKHRQNLAGANFYANKLVELRADAINAFRDLSARTVGDVSAMAEMIEAVFSPHTVPKDRLAIARELFFSLRTTWRRQSKPSLPKEEEGLFPLSILGQTQRGYLTSIGRQMNGCYSAGWYDPAVVMMRRLIEISIIEAFEGRSLAHKIKDTKGDYLHLSDLIDRALAEGTWTLSRNTRRILPQLRDVGHMSAHGRYYTARKEDIERVRQGCRVAVEEFLHHANLL